MTFLAPLWLMAAAGVSAGVVLLHFFARRRPNEMVLPTARFIPPHSAQSTTRTLKPNDLLLMLMRIAIVMAAGAALSKPAFAPRRQERAGIVLADVSRATTSLEELRARVAAVRREGDVVIPFDSAPRGAGDSISALSGARGSLSAALLAGLETARTMRTRADSVQLTIVSAMREEEMDRATPMIRALWPGRVSVELLSRSHEMISPARVEVRGEAADPLIAAARLHLPLAGIREGREDPRARSLRSLAGDDKDAAKAREVRIIRDRVIGADSAWVVAEGRALVVWPARGDTLAGARALSNALIAGDAVLVAPLARFGQLPDGAVIARWADGEPAATESASGDGCIRTVGVSIPAAGDLVLRPEFGRLLRVLTAPCDAALVSPPASAPVITSLAGSGPLATGRAFPAATRSSSLAPWLLAFALLLALVEPFVRRGARPT